LLFHGDEQVEKVQDKFRKDLEEFKNKVMDRNNKAGINYKWLLPEGIPNSVSV
jgi:hypothetical protein